MSKRSSKTSASELLREFVQLSLEGVPNYKLQSLTDDFTLNLGNVIKQHMRVSKKYTSYQQAEAYRSLHVALKNIENQINDIVDDELRALLYDL